jgi:hypothetical protein
MLVNLHQTTRHPEAARPGNTFYLDGVDRIYTLYSKMYRCLTSHGLGSTRLWQARSGPQELQAASRNAVLQALMWAQRTSPIKAILYYLWLGKKALLNVEVERVLSWAEMLKTRCVNVTAMKENDCFIDWLLVQFHTTTTPWPESASELYRPSDRRLSAKLVPTFVYGGCHVVSVTDPYGRNLGFPDQSHYFFLK